MFSAHGSRPAAVRTAAEPTGDRGILLTIIVPTYNRLNILQNLIESRLGQIGRSDVETIIVDDCSTDGTWEWLSSVCPSLNGFSCYRTAANSGPAPTRNIALDRARGRYFVLCDSDMMPLPGAIDRICSLVESHSERNMIFFPCIGYPSMKRMDSISGSRDISSEDMLYGRTSGEIIPIGRVSYFNSRGLRFPQFRSGCEAILWIRATSEEPALFVDEPLYYYRTDVAGRISTAEHQLSHSEDMAQIADAFTELFPDEVGPEGIAERARRYAAAGMYYLLAGNTGKARQRLRKAIRDGNIAGRLLLLASFCGTRFCRAGFRLYRLYK